jgi:hypothetical protein
MLIDTHCHLDAAEFGADRDAVAQRAFAPQSGGSRIQIFVDIGIIITPYPIWKVLPLWQNIFPRRSGIP